jgi:hypothetical protein
MRCSKQKRQALSGVFFMMWALYLLIFIGLSLLIFLAVSFVLFRPEDHSAFDSHEFKSRTALPSIANKEVIERVRTMG